MPISRRTFLGTLPAAAWAQEKPPVPPREHPRVFLRAGDVAAIRARLPKLERAWTRVLADSRADAGDARIERVATIAKSKALVRLLTGDDAAGRQAVALMVDRLPGAEWDVKIQDISRAIGATMLAAGLVYDWCYPLLSGSDKQTLITHMERLAGMMEVGYPPTRQSSITGHAGEAMILRDLLGAGIAMYDEKPYMYDVSAQRIFAEHIPARNFFYPAHMHHQGSGYGPYRFRYEMYAAWILKRMTGRDYFIKDQGQVPYHWIYSRRPDGKRMPSGDVTSETGTNAFMLAAAYYNDPLLAGEYLDAPDAHRVDPVDVVLFWDPALQPQSRTSLPRARFFGSPLSSVVARTSWDEDATIVEMKATDYQFNNHHHLDAGAFQIWHRAPLAIDSGVYKGYGTEHDYCYYKRTVAHNAMLVYDPEEQFVGGKAANDGGQRWPNERREPRNLESLLRDGYRVGKVLGHEISERYAYLEGDLTGAYSNKVQAYQRAFAFLPLERGAALVVLDRIRARFPRTWLLHSVGEPEVRGNAITIRNGGGKLMNYLLAPGDARVEKVGGPGREFRVAGKNYPPAALHGEAGAWRVEISSAADVFLNVMQTMDESAAPLPVEKIETATQIGVRIGGRTALFARNAGEAGTFSFQQEKS